MSAPARITQPKVLYKRFIRASKRFNQYNYREYALRRVREEFRNNKNLTDGQLEEAIKFGNEQLLVVERQSIINAMYAHDDIVLNRV